MSDNECATTPTPTPYIGIGGRTRYSAYCTTCGAPCSGWTEQEARDAFEAHRAIPAPPADVLARPITFADVKDYPDYFISGPGRRIASATDCGHGYHLTDSCPCCD